MKYETAIKFAGSVTGLQSLFPPKSLSHQAIYKWKKTGRVPKGKAYELQIVTGGKLKVDPAAY